MISVAKLNMLLLFNFFFLHFRVLNQVMYIPYVSFPEHVFIEYKENSIHNNHCKRQPKYGKVVFIFPRLI